MHQASLRIPLLAVLITIGLSFGLWFLSYSYLGSRIEEDLITITEQRTTLARTTTLASQTADLKNQEPIAQSYQRVISVLLPNQEQLLEVPRSIEQIARTQGVDATFTFTGSGNSGSVEPGASLPFRIAAAGPPNNLALFFRDFEVAVPRYTFDVQTVSFSGSVVDGNKYQLSLVGSIYYQ